VGKKMNLKLSMILNADIKNIELISDGEFNSLALANGKLKKDTKLLIYINSLDFISFIGKNSEITCVICTKEIFEILKNKKDDIISKIGIAISDNPKAVFFMFHNYLNRNTNFYKNDFEKQIDVTARIHSTCIIPDRNIIIGKNVILGPFVVLYENTNIEDNVFISAGSVIGHPAFYYFENDGIRNMVDSVGSVIIREYAEIHSHVIICKGVLGGVTEIGRNTKIDGHVFVGHDVQIKENCVIPSGSKFGGSVIVDGDCYIGTGTIIAPQIHIKKGSKTSAGAVVVKNVKENTHVSGNFAIDHVKYVNFIRKITSNV
jgi:UDP-3-O-[3-hydroxymyristoyl] glucosamine N-acyltransferase